MRLQQTPKRIWFKTLALVLCLVIPMTEIGPAWGEIIPSGVGTGFPAHQSFGEGGISGDHGQPRGAALTHDIFVPPELGTIQETYDASVRAGPRAVWSSAAGWPSGGRPLGSPAPSGRDGGRALGRTALRGWRCAGPPLILHIQDAHGNLSAQESMAALVKHFHESYGIHLVTVEGAAGELEMEEVRNFPDAEIRTRVARKYLESFDLTGDEFYVISENPDLVMYGAERMLKYYVNRDQFFKARAESEKIKPVLARLRTSIRNLENRIYNKDLREFVRRQKQVKDHPAFLPEYIRYLQPADGPPLHTVDELKKVEHEVKNHLIQTESEKRLLELTNLAVLLEKLLTLSLAPEEYTEILKEKGKLTEEYFRRRFEDSVPDFAPIFSSLDIFFSFYRLAEERNDELAANTLKAMRNRRAPSAIMISGGFHTPGLTERWKQKGISYLIIQPNMAVTNDAGKDLSAYQMKAAQAARSVLSISKVSMAERGFGADVPWRRELLHHMLDDMNKELQAGRLARSTRLGVTGDSEPVSEIYSPKVSHAGFGNSKLKGHGYGILSSAAGSLSAIFLQTALQGGFPIWPALIVSALTGDLILSLIGNLRTPNETAMASEAKPSRINLEIASASPGTLPRNDTRMHRLFSLAMILATVLSYYAGALGWFLAASYAGLVAKRLIAAGTASEAHPLRFRARVGITLPVLAQLFGFLSFLYFDAVFVLLAGAVGIIFAGLIEYLFSLKLFTARQIAAAVITFGSLILFNFDRLPVLAILPIAFVILYPLARSAGVVILKFVQTDLPAMSSVEQVRIGNSMLFVVLFSLYTVRTFYHALLGDGGGWTDFVSLLAPLNNGTAGVSGLIVSWLFLLVLSRVAEFAAVKYTDSSTSSFFRSTVGIFAFFWKGFFISGFVPNVATLVKLASMGLTVFGVGLFIRSPLHPIAKRLSRASQTPEVARKEIFARFSEWEGALNNYLYLSKLKHRPEKAVESLERVREKTREIMNLAGDRTGLSRERIFEELRTYARFYPVHSRKHPELARALENFEVLTQWLGKSEAGFGASARGVLLHPQYAGSVIDDGAEMLEETQAEQTGDSDHLGNIVTENGGIPDFQISDGELFNIDQGRMNPAVGREHRQSLFPKRGIVANVAHRSPINHRVSGARIKNQLHYRDSLRTDHLDTRNNDSGSFFGEFDFHQKRIAYPLGTIGPAYRMYTFFTRRGFNFSWSSWRNLLWTSTLPSSRASSVNLNAIHSFLNFLLAVSSFISKTPFAAESLAQPVFGVSRRSRGNSGFGAAGENQTHRVHKRRTDWLEKAKENVARVKSEVRPEEAGQDPFYYALNDREWAMLKTREDHLERDFISPKSRLRRIPIFELTTGKQIGNPKRIDSTTIEELRGESYKTSIAIATYVNSVGATGYKNHEIIYLPYQFRNRFGLKVYKHGFIVGARLFAAEEQPEAYVDILRDKDTGLVLGFRAWAAGGKPKTYMKGLLYRVKGGSEEILKSEEPDNIFLSSDRRVKAYDFKTASVRDLGAAELILASMYTRNLTQSAETLSENEIVFRSVEVKKRGTFRLGANYYAKHGQKINVGGMTGRKDLEGRDGFLTVYEARPRAITLPRSESSENRAAPPAIALFGLGPSSHDLKEGRAGNSLWNFKHLVVDGKESEEVSRIYARTELGELGQYLFSVRRDQLQHLSRMISATLPKIRDLVFTNLTQKSGSSVSWGKERLPIPIKMLAQIPIDEVHVVDGHIDQIKVHNDLVAGKIDIKVIRTPDGKPTGLAVSVNGNKEVFYGFVIAEGRDDHGKDAHHLFLSHARRIFSWAERIGFSGKVRGPIPILRLPDVVPRLYIGASRSGKPGILYRSDQFAEPFELEFKGGALSTFYFPSSGERISEDKLRIALRGKPDKAGQLKLQSEWQGLVTSLAHSEHSKRAALYAALSLDAEDLKGVALMAIFLQAERLPLDEDLNPQTLKFSIFAAFRNHLDKALGMYATNVNRRKVMALHRLEVSASNSDSKLSDAEIISRLGLASLEELRGLRDLARLMFPHQFEPEILSETENDGFGFSSGFGNEGDVMKGWGRPLDKLLKIGIPVSVLESALEAVHENFNGRDESSWFPQSKAKIMEWLEAPTIKVTEAESPEEVFTIEHLLDFIVFMLLEKEVARVKFRKEGEKINAFFEATKPSLLSVLVQNDGEDRRDWHVNADEMKSLELLATDRFQTRQYEKTVRMFQEPVMLSPAAYTPGQTDLFLTYSDETRKAMIRYLKNFLEENGGNLIAGPFQHILGKMAQLEGADRAYPYPAGFGAGAEEALLHPQYAGSVIDDGAEVLEETQAEKAGDIGHVGDVVAYSRNITGFEISHNHFIDGDQRGTNLSIGRYHGDRFTSSRGIVTQSARHFPVDHRVDSARVQNDVWSSGGRPLGQTSPRGRRGEVYRPGRFGADKSYAWDNNAASFSRKFNFHQKRIAYPLGTIGPAYRMYTFFTRRGFNFSWSSWRNLLWTSTLPSSRASSVNLNAIHSFLNFLLAVSSFISKTPFAAESLAQPVFGVNEGHGNSGFGSDRIKGIGYGMLSNMSAGLSLILGLTMIHAGADVLPLIFSATFAIDLVLSLNNFLVAAKERSSVRNRLAGAGLFFAALVVVPAAFHYGVLGWFLGITYAALSLIRIGKAISSRGPPVMSLKARAGIALIILSHPFAYLALRYFDPVFILLARAFSPVISGFLEYGFSVKRFSSQQKISALITFASLILFSFDQLPAFAAWSALFVIGYSLFGSLGLFILKFVQTDLPKMSSLEQTRVAHTTSLWPLFLMYAIQLLGSGRYGQADGWEPISALVAPLNAASFSEVGIVISWIFLLIVSRTSEFQSLKLTDTSSVSFFRSTAGIFSFFWKAILISALVWSPTTWIKLAAMVITMTGIGFFVRSPAHPVARKLALKSKNRSLMQPEVFKRFSVWESAMSDYFYLSKLKKKPEKAQASLDRIRQTTKQVMELAGDESGLSRADLWGGFQTLIRLFPIHPRKHPELARAFENLDALTPWLESPASGFGAEGMEKENLEKNEETRDRNMKVSPIGTFLANRLLGAGYLDLENIWVVRFFRLIGFLPRERTGPDDERIKNWLIQRQLSWEPRYFYFLKGLSKMAGEEKWGIDIMDELEKLPLPRRESLMYIAYRNSGVLTHRTQRAIRTILAAFLMISRFISVFVAVPLLWSHPLGFSGDLMFVLAYFGVCALLKKLAFTIHPKNTGKFEHVVIDEVLFKPGIISAATRENLQKRLWIKESVRETVSMAIPPIRINWNDTAQAHKQLEGKAKVVSRKLADVAEAEKGTFGYHVSSRRGHVYYTFEWKHLDLAKIILAAFPGARFTVSTLGMRKDSPGKQVSVVYGLKIMRDSLDSPYHPDEPRIVNLSAIPFFFRPVDKFWFTYFIVPISVSLIFPLFSMLISHSFDTVFYEIVIGWWFLVLLILVGRFWKNWKKKHVMQDLESSVELVERKLDREFSRTVAFPNFYEGGVGAHIEEELELRKFSSELEKIPKGKNADWVLTIPSVFDISSNRLAETRFKIFFGRYNDKRIELSVHIERHDSNKNVLHVEEVRFAAPGRPFFREATSAFLMNLIRWAHAREFREVIIKTELGRASGFLAEAQTKRIGGGAMKVEIERPDGESLKSGIILHVTFPDALPSGFGAAPFDQAPVGRSGARHRAVGAARLPRGFWTKGKIDEGIKLLVREKLPLSYVSVTKDADGKIKRALSGRFGETVTGSAFTASTARFYDSWEVALEANGVNVEKTRQHMRWSVEKIVEGVKALHKEGLIRSIQQDDSGKVKAVLSKVFGKEVTGPAFYAAALKYIGPWEEVLKKAELSSKEIQFALMSEEDRELFKILTEMGYQPLEEEKIIRWWQTGSIHENVKSAEGELLLPENNFVFGHVIEITDYRKTQRKHAKMKTPFTVDDRFTYVMVSQLNPSRPSHPYRGVVFKRYAISDLLAHFRKNPGTFALPESGTTYQYNPEKKLAERVNLAALDFLDFRRGLVPAKDEKPDPDSLELVEGRSVKSNLMLKAMHGDHYNFSVFVVRMERSNFEISINEAKRAEVFRKVKLLKGKSAGKTMDDEEIRETVKQLNVRVVLERQADLLSGLVANVYWEEDYLKRDREPLLGKEIGSGLLHKRELNGKVEFNYRSYDLNRLAVAYVSAGRRNIKAGRYIALKIWPGRDNSENGNISMIATIYNDKDWGAKREINLAIPEDVLKHYDLKRGEDGSTVHLRVEDDINHGVHLALYPSNDFENGRPIRRWRYSDVTKKPEPVDMVHEDIKALLNGRTDIKPRENGKWIDADLKTVGEKIWAEVKLDQRKNPFIPIPDDASRAIELTLANSESVDLKVRVGCFENETPCLELALGDEVLHQYTEFPLETVQEFMVERDRQSKPKREPKPPRPPRDDSKRIESERIQRNAEQVLKKADYDKLSEEQIIRWVKTGESLPAKGFIFGRPRKIKKHERENPRSRYVDPSKVYLVVGKNKFVTVLDEGTLKVHDLKNILRGDFSSPLRVYTFDSLLGKPVLRNLTGRNQTEIEDMLKGLGYQMLTQEQAIHWWRTGKKDYPGAELPDKGFILGKVREIAEAERRLARFKDRSRKHRISGETRLVTIIEQDFNQGMVLKVFNISDILKNNFSKPQLVYVFNQAYKRPVRRDLADLDVTDFLRGKDIVPVEGRLARSKVYRTQNRKESRIKSERKKIKITHSYVVRVLAQPAPDVKKNISISVRPKALAGHDISKEQTVILIEDDPEHGQVANVYWESDYAKTAEERWGKEIGSGIYDAELKSVRSINLNRLSVLAAMRGQVDRLKEGRFIEAKILPVRIESTDSGGNKSSEIKRFIHVRSFEDKETYRLQIPGGILEAAGIKDYDTVFVRVENDKNQGIYLAVYKDKNFKTKSLVTFKHLAGTHVPGRATLKRPLRQISLAYLDVIDVVLGRKDIKPGRAIKRKLYIHFVDDQVFYRVGMSTLSSEEKSVQLLVPRDKRRFVEETLQKEPGMRADVVVKEDPDYGIYLELSLAGQVLGNYQFDPKRNECRFIHLDKMRVRDWAHGVRNTHGEPIDITRTLKTYAAASGKKISLTPKSIPEWLVREAKSCLIQRLAQLYFIKEPTDGVFRISQAEFIESLKKRAVATILSIASSDEDKISFAYMLGSDELMERLRGETFGSAVTGNRYMIDFIQDRFLLTPHGGEVQKVESMDHWIDRLAEDLAVQVRDKASYEVNGKLISFERTDRFIRVGEFVFIDKRQMRLPHWFIQDHRHRIVGTLLAPAAEGEPMDFISGSTALLAAIAMIGYRDEIDGKTVLIDDAHEPSLILLAKRLGAKSVNILDVDLTEQVYFQGLFQVNRFDPEKDLIFSPFSIENIRGVENKDVQIVISNHSPASSYVSDIFKTFPGLELYVSAVDIDRKDTRTFVDQLNGRGHRIIDVVNLGASSFANVPKGTFPAKETEELIRLVIRPNPFSAEEDSLAGFGASDDHSSRGISPRLEFSGFGAARPPPAVSKDGGDKETEGSGEMILDSKGEVQPKSPEAGAGGIRERLEAFAGSETGFRSVVSALDRIRDFAAGLADGEGTDKNLKQLGPLIGEYLESLRLFAVPYDDKKAELVEAQSEYFEAINGMILGKFKSAELLDELDFLLGGVDAMMQELVGDVSEGEDEDENEVTSDTTLRRFDDGIPEVRLPLAKDNMTHRAPIIIKEPPMSKDTEEQLKEAAELLAGGRLSVESARKALVVLDRGRNPALASHLKYFLLSAQALFEQREFDRALSLLNEAKPQFHSVESTRKLIDVGELVWNEANKVPDRQPYVAAKRIMAGIISGKEDFVKAEDVETFKEIKDPALRLNAIEAWVESQSADPIKYPGEMYRLVVGPSGLTNERFAELLGVTITYVENRLRVDKAAISKDDFRKAIAAARQGLIEGRQKDAEKTARKEEIDRLRNIQDAAEQISAIEAWLGKLREDRVEGAGALFKALLDMTRLTLKEFGTAVGLESKNLKASAHQMVHNKIRIRKHTFLKAVALARDAIAKGVHLQPRVKRQRKLSVPGILEGLGGRSALRGKTLREVSDMAGDRITYEAIRNFLDKTNGYEAYWILKPKTRSRKGEGGKPGGSGFGATFGQAPPVVRAAVGRLVHRHRPVGTAVRRSVGRHRAVGAAIHAGISPIHERMVSDHLSRFRRMLPENAAGALELVYIRKWSRDAVAKQLKVSKRLYDAVMKEAPEFSLDGLDHAAFVKRFDGELEAKLGPKPARILRAVALEEKTWDALASELNIAPDDARAAYLLSLQMLWNQAGITDERLLADRKRFLFPLLAGSHAEVLRQHFLRERPLDEIDLDLRHAHYVDGSVTVDYVRELKLTALGQLWNLVSPLSDRDLIFVFQPVFKILSEGRGKVLSLRKGDAPEAFSEIGKQIGKTRSPAQFIYHLGLYDLRQVALNDAVVRQLFDDAIEGKRIKSYAQASDTASASSDTFKYAPFPITSDVKAQHAYDEILSRQSSIPTPQDLAKKLKISIPLARIVARKFGFDLEETPKPWHRRLSSLGRYRLGFTDEVPPKRKVRLHKRPGEIKLRVRLGNQDIRLPRNFQAKGDYAWAFFARPNEETRDLVVSFQPEERSPPPPAAPLFRVLFRVAHDGKLSVEYPKEEGILDPIRLRSIRIDGENALPELIQHARAFLSQAVVRAGASLRFSKSDILKVSKAELTQGIRARTGSAASVNDATAGALMERLSGQRLYSSFLPEGFRYALSVEGEHLILTPVNVSASRGFGFVGRGKGKRRDFRNRPDAILKQYKTIYVSGEEFETRIVEAVKREGFPLELSPELRIPVVDKDRKKAELTAEALRRELMPRGLKPDQIKASDHVDAVMRDWLLNGEIVAFSDKKDFPAGFEHNVIRNNQAWVDFLIHLTSHEAFAAAA